MGGTTSPRLLALAVGAVLLSIVLSVFAKPPVPEVTTEGLHLVKHTKLAAVYLKPGADFSGYSEFRVLDCYVAFRKNWRRGQNRSNLRKVSNSDVARIKNEVAQRFKKVLIKELEGSGMTLATERAGDVLVLRPAIINLDVAVPDTRSAVRERTYAMDTGQMTLFLEIYDGATSDLLARVIDPERAQNFGTVVWQSPGANKVAAYRILKKWSDRLGAYLAEARSAGVKSAHNPGAK